MRTRVKANIGSGFAVFCSQLLAEVSGIIIFAIIIIIIVVVLMMMMRRRRVQYTVKLCRISLVELHSILLLLHVNAGLTKRERDRMILMISVYNDSSNDDNDDDGQKVVEGLEHKLMFVILPDLENGGIS